MALFQDLNEKGITLLIVTHEDEVAAYAKRVIELRDGRIIRDETQQPKRAADDLKRMIDEDAVAFIPE
jgi:putative ABC transport system ATP-binding protein